MNSIQKVVSSFAATALVIGSFVTPVFGATATNYNCEDSSCTANADELDVLGVLNLQLGSVNNDTFALSNTGANSMNDNEDGASMSTGGAGAGAVSDNLLNSTIVDVSGSGSTGAVAGNNTIDDSSANALADNSNWLILANVNLGYINNDSVALSNTGFNYMGGNEDGVSMITGDAGSLAMSANNLNSTDVNVSGFGGGSATATNYDVEDSEAVAEAENTNVLGIANINVGAINNDSVAMANTGANTMSENEGDDSGVSMVTGNALAGAVSDNTVNSSTTTVIGSPDGGAVATNSTIDDSSAVASADNTNVIIVANVNAGAVNNDSVAAANTGANSVVGNEDGSSMTTGAAVSCASSTNTVNTNVTTISL